MQNAAMSIDQEAEMVAKLREGRDRIRAELSKTIVGQDDVIEQLLLCLFTGGHCLIT